MQVESAKSTRNPFFICKVFNASTKQQLLFKGPRVFCILLHHSSAGPWGILSNRSGSVQMCTLFSLFKCAWSLFIENSGSVLLLALQDLNFNQSGPCEEGSTSCPSALHHQVADCWCHKLKLDEQKRLFDSNRTENLLAEWGCAHCHFAHL